MILPNALTHTHVNPALIVSEVRTLAETYENGNEERREETGRSKNEERVQHDKGNSVLLINASALSAQ